MKSELHINDRLQGELGHCGRTLSSRKAASNHQTRGGGAGGGGANQAQHIRLLRERKISGGEF